MHRYRILALAFCLSTSGATPLFAEEIDSLKGKFAFDWLVEADKAKCVVVSDKLLASLQTDFDCKLEMVTNTASEQPAQTCAKRDGTSEFLIFATQKACDEEREVQASNAE